MTRDERIEQFLPLVYKRAKALAKGMDWRGDLDDLIGDGMVGLVYAADHYRAEKSKFITYAWMCIDHHIISGRRNWSPYSRSQQKAGVSFKHEPVTENTKTEPPPDIATRLDVETAIRALPTQERIAVTHIYLNDGNKQDAVPGRSKGYAWMVHGRAKDRLRRGALKAYAA